MRQDNKAQVGNKNPGRARAQAVVEFTVATVVFIGLAFGMVQILRWAPKILSNAADQHDQCMQYSDSTPGCLGVLPSTPINATMN